MVSCAIKFCQNYCKTKRDVTSNVGFHRFPTDAVIAARWTKIVRRTRNDQWWKPFNSARICSEHFHSRYKYVTDKGIPKLKRGAIPSECLFLNWKEIEDDEQEKENPSDVVHVAAAATCSVPNNSKQTKSAHLRIISTTAQPERDIVEVAMQLSNIATEDANEEKSDRTIEYPPDLDDIDSSDLESIFDTPKEVNLRTLLKRKIKLQKKHTIKINRLRNQNRILKRRNASLKELVKLLKKELNKYK